MRPDSIVEVSSSYQNIRIARHPWKVGEIVLYCDHMWQFDSSIEHRYHEGLATLQAACSESLDRVLVAGGGDGLIVRDLLRFPDVGRVDLVEIDPVMIKLFANNPFSRYNAEALNDPRVKVTVGDALKFARESTELYDQIILDFPSPGEDNADKGYENLFSPDNLQVFMDRLRPWGVLSAQIGISNDGIYAWMNRVLDQGYRAWIYDVAYNPRSHDTIATICRNYLEPRRKIPAGCRWATDKRLFYAFSDVTQVTRDALEFSLLFECADDIEYGEVYDGISSGRD